jgi:alpha-tubulin suppressor-like RCC1 family protein
LGISSSDDKLVLDKPKLNIFFEKNKLKVVDIVCDGNHTIVLTKSGKVFSFGNGKYQKFKVFGSLFSRTLCLGHEKSENLNKPKLIKTLKENEIKLISTNKHCALAVDKKNKVFVWGRGEWGVNGMGNSNAIQTPTENLLLKGIFDSLDKPKVVKILGCSDFSSVLLSNGDVFSFGNNDQGVMGLEKSMGVDMTESISFPQPMFREALKVDGEGGKIMDIELGEVISILHVKPENNDDHPGQLFWGGWKLSSLPEPIPFDFVQDPPKLISASDKGWAFVTKNNRY